MCKKLFFVMAFIMLLGLAAEPVAADWEPVGLSGGGAMFNPAISPIDPNLMMVNCDMGGAYLSHDGGMTWKVIIHSRLGTNTQCQAGFHPTNIDTIFAAVGSKLRVSYDRGDGWEQIASFSANMEGQIAIDTEDPSLMLVGAAGSVRRSTDGGENWTTAAGPNGEVFGFHYDMTSPVANRVCFVGTENGVWRSDDRGATWTKKTDGLPWENLQGFAGGSNAGTQTVIIYCSILSQDIGGFQGGVYKSTDLGENWVSAMGPGINMDTEAYDGYAMGDIAQYYDILTTNVDPQIVYTYNSSTGFWPPHHPTVYRSANAGDSWQAKFYQDPRFSEYNVEYNYHTAYLGQAWQSLPHGTAIAPSEPDRVMHTDNEMCYITHDGGDTWFNGQTRPVPGSGDPPEDFFNTGLVVTSTWHYYIDPFEPGRRYIAYTDIGFARSLDADQSWKWGYTEIPWNNTCYELAFDPDTPGQIWGAFSNTHDIPQSNVILGGHAPDNPGGVGISYDYSATWSQSNTGLPEAPACSVIVDPTSTVGSRTLYAAIFGHGVYKSTDDGGTWTKKSNGLGSVSNMRAYRVRRHSDGTLFCVVTALYSGGAFNTDGVGVYKSTDQANSWTRINSTLLWPKDITIDPADSDIIYVGATDAGGNGQGGLWRTTNGGGSWVKLERKGEEHFGAYLHPTRPGWIYMTLGDWNPPPDAGLWLSKDNGDTWEGFMELPFANIQRVTFDPNDENTIYVTTFGGSVFKGHAEPGQVAPGRANNPIPANGATSVGINADLNWTAGSGATSHDVYFGTDSTPDSGEFMGNQPGTAFDPGTLANDTTYYWRIDEVNAYGTTTGTVWSFTTVPVTGGELLSNPGFENGTTDWSMGDANQCTVTNEDPHSGSNSAKIVGNSNWLMITQMYNSAQAGMNYYISGWMKTIDVTASAQLVVQFLDSGWGILDDYTFGQTTGTTGYTEYSNGYLSPAGTVMVRLRLVLAGGTGTVYFDDLSLTASDPNTPGQASNPSPSNGATDVEIDADLSWTAGSGSTSSDVYFGTSSPGTFQGNQTATTFEPGTLANDTTYYWRIDEVNAGGTTTGTVWNFTTIVAPPAQATNPNPGNGAGDVDINANLSWTAGSGATSHDVYFGTSSPGSYQGNQAAATFDPGTMANDTTYYWRIDEVNAGGTTTGSVWSFTTEVAAVPPPGQASNPSPADSAANVAVNTDLSWTAGSDTTSHDVYFGTSSPGSYQGNQTATTFDTGTMANDTTYHWRIDEVGLGGTTTGNVWSFTTIVAAPGQASNPSPSNGATDLSITADLSWSAGSGATSHDVYFGISSPGAFQGNQTATTFDTGTMANDTTYYWRVDEVNAQGTTTGVVWSFTTMVEAGSEPIGWWQLDEGSGAAVEDSSSYGNDGTIDGPVWLNDAEHGWCLDFDGDASDKVVIPNEPFFDLTGNITVMGWIKATYVDWRNLSAVISKGTDGGGWALQKAQRENGIGFYADVSGMPWYGVKSNVAVFDNTWHHVAGVYDGSKAYIYVDGGADVNSIDCSGSIGTNDYAVWVGNNSQSIREWAGLLSDVRVYDRALSQSEINDIYTGEPTPPGQASNPSPADTATDVDIDADLSWTAGSGSTSSDVYFGTSSPGSFQGNQTATTFDPGTMSNDTTYYWRIDEVNAAGTTTGVVWNFTTIAAAPSQASNPSPADSATDVSVDADLSWTAGSGATSRDAYFGTTSPGSFQGNQTATTFDPGTMANDTTYYWRIDEVNAAGTTTGSVWSFTTVAAPEWTELTYDDFESGWGNYTDGGGDCSLYTYGTYAHQGSNAADIQDNSGVSSSFYHTNGIDVDTPGYTQLRVEFWYIPVSMDNSNEDFWLQYYDGTDWHTVETWVRGVDFDNGTPYNPTVYIDESSYTFPTNMQIRFMCDASNNRDDVYIDEIRVSAQ